MIIVKPIFYQGKRVGWSGSMTHTADTGGMLRGASTEIFHEGIRYQGIKLVEGGKLRSDIFRSITQQCRDPDLVGLDLKARIASNNVCSKGYVELIEKYGVEFIMAASEKVIADAEREARAKLRRLPDGTWRSRTYYTTFTRGSEGEAQIRPFKFVAAVTKAGDTLTVDATGTSPQNPDYHNATFTATWSMLYFIIAGFLFWDLPWNAGMAAVVKFIAPEGTVVNCRFPAASGMAPRTGGMFSEAVHDRVSKMLYAGGLLEDVMASLRGRGGGGEPGMWYGGHDQRGGIVGQAIYDNFASGLGATPYRDGVNSGGLLVNAQACIADVEFTEMYYPFIYLARHQLKDSGGFGKYAGGMDIENLLMVYGSQDLSVDYVPTPTGIAVRGHGLFGGYPMGSVVGGGMIIRIEKMKERLKKESRWPFTLDELLLWGDDYRTREDTRGARRGDIGIPRMPVNEYDVIEYQWEVGSGYGDPIDRDPNKVAQDIRNEAISLETAVKVYGVVLAPETLEIKLAETDKRRQEIRDERLKKGTRIVEDKGERKSTTAKPLLRMHEYLEIAERDDGKKIIRCIKCGYEFCDARENYKKYALRWTRDLSEVKQVPERVSSCYYQEYICPGCATLLQVDIWWPTLDSDEPLWDIQIKV